MDAVANQAELISAETGVAEEFSLWNLKDTVSEFDLTVGFHDVDKTEDHCYILVEIVAQLRFPLRRLLLPSARRQQYFTHRH